MPNSITPKDAQSALAQKHVILLDVRRKSDKESGAEGIAGARWHDPELVEEWKKEYDKNASIIFYCVRGGSVSQSVANSLRESHPNAKYIEGGLTAWQAQE